MLDVTELPPFSTLPVEAVAGLLRQGDTFAGLNRQGGDLIDSCAPEAGTEVDCYEAFLSLLACRLIRATEEVTQKKTGKAGGAASPRLQKDAGELASALNLYIREWMFGESFNPLADDGWRVLLLLPLTAHIVRVFSSALMTATRDKIGQQVRTRCRRRSSGPN